MKRLKPSLSQIALLLLLGGACSRAITGAPSATTRELIHDDAELRTMVDDLAAEKLIASERIGYAGAPSRAYIIFASIRGRATEDQMIALLTHESPVVRGYAAQDVAARMPRAYAKLEPLLVDRTSVETMSGCILRTRTVSEVVIEALCAQRSESATKTQATKMLDRVAKDGNDEERHVVERCVRYD